jgi:hypothetical protein
MNINSYCSSYNPAVQLNWPSPVAAADACCCCQEEVSVVLDSGSD